MFERLKVISDGIIAGEIATTWEQFRSSCSIMLDDSLITIEEFKYLTGIIESNNQSPVVVQAEYTPSDKEDKLPDVLSFETTMAMRPDHALNLERALVAAGEVVDKTCQVRVKYKPDDVCITLFVGRSQKQFFVKSSRIDEGVVQVLVGDWRFVESHGVAHNQLMAVCALFIDALMQLCKQAGWRAIRLKGDGTMCADWAKSNGFYFMWKAKNGRYVIWEKRVE